MATLEDISKSMDKIEAALETQSKKADEEIKNIGKVSHDTKTAIDNIGIEQVKMADRLLQLEQKGLLPPQEKTGELSCGEQFVKSGDYEALVKSDFKQRASVKLTKAVLTTSGGIIAPDRKPGIVPGTAREFTLFDYLLKLPTASNSIEYVRENVFVNNAAAVAEGSQKPETTITFEKKSMAVSTIAHWTKISKQLVADGPSFAAYVNFRMIYGAEEEREDQVVSGDGLQDRLLGLTAAGNFVPHAYTAGILTAAGLSPSLGIDLIGKMLGDCAVAGYPANVIVLNTADWWTLRLKKDTTGAYLLGPANSDVVPILHGRPVVASNAMPINKVWVGNLQRGMTYHDRQEVTVDVSPHDADNFTKNLVTVLAELRGALTVEIPAAGRYGDLILV